MAYKSIEDLIKNRVFYHFSEISRIPRQTFFEKEISDFISNWAKNLALEVKQDERYNLLIRKPATLGYEDKKPIIIQAHIDMVCEKKPEVEHDFKKDPIKLVLDGDILSTGNRTTLGADDGIGVAMAMAVLEDKHLKHPQIDVILTTAEEEDMSGALNVDRTWFNTNRLINIDHVVDNEIIAGSCGGKGAELKFPLEYTEKPNNYQGYKIKISGLRGGHSGEDIHKGRANANILMAELLNLLREKIDFLISDLKGGNFRLAIPREAYVTVALEEKNIECFKELVSNFENEIKKVYEETAKDLKIEVSEEKLAEKLLSKETVYKIIDAIILSPNGISNMIGSLNVVESSCNLGEVYIEENYIYLVTEIRATFEKNKNYIYNKISLIAKYLGGELKDFAEYPSWTYRANSSLRNTANKVYSEIFGEEIKTLAVHAGLECGCFVDKIEEDMDAISIGPNTWDLHSPSERLSISSAEKVYNYLVKILENLD
ncbi:beta-Ala-His dipeptidase [Fusobacterium russii]|uniref:beta-Ala-His dipeptidase n=1 Tax=Fusobacterium russii TaxID=854 RepID=UPI000399A5F3|nr:beta-Ala-His dipeptidase [Fusobacterium russii]